MVSYNGLTNFLLLHFKEKRYLTKKFRNPDVFNVKVTCAHCIICKAVQQGKLYKVTKSEEYWWNFKLGNICYQRQALSMDFNKTAGPAEQWALVGRTPHTPTPFLQIQKKKNRITGTIVPPQMF